MTTATEKKPKNFRVKITWGSGSYSYHYFHTQEEAEDYAPEPRFNMLGYPANHKRLTVQERGGKGWPS